MNNSKTILNPLLPTAFYDKGSKLTASPLMMWLAAFNIQKLLVAHAVEIE